MLIQTDGLVLKKKKQGGERGKTIEIILLSYEAKRFVPFSSSRTVSCGTSYKQELGHLLL
jgi:hypothetical protein